MKAAILCAGLGSRLGVLTQKTPKPMLSINGEPLLAHNLRYLAANGCDDILINLHYFSDQITSYFKDGADFGVKIQYSYEEQLLGTAGAIKKAEYFFKDAAMFFVMYGDLLIDQDLSPMIAAHKRNDAAATILLHRRHHSNSLVRMDDSGRITGFFERPSPAIREENPFPWVNSALYLISPRILPCIPENQPVDFPRDLFEPLYGRERFYGFPLTGYRCAIDSAERYETAKLAFSNGTYKYATLAFPDV